MSTIGIIGAGSVGAGLATTLVQAGHSVRLTNSEAGSQRLADAAAASGAHATSIADAVASDVVILALPYAAAVDFARDHHQALAGKIVVDATNALTVDFTGLDHSGGASAAQVIAAVAPRARIVKAFNTVFAATYSNQTLRDASQFVPVSSDDEEAAAAVVELAKSIGFDAIHVGDLSTAAFVEQTVLNLIHLGFFKGFGGSIGLTLVRG